MGYYMNSMNCSFALKKENVKAAWESIKNLLQEKKEIGWTSWESIKNCCSFEEVMAECGWEVYINEKGDYDAIIFINEKASNDIVILNAIAPYVEPNSYIQMQGEDGEIWRWVFEDGQVKEIYPTILWN